MGFILHILINQLDVHCAPGRSFGSLIKQRLACLIQQQSHLEADNLNYKFSPDWDLHKWMMAAWGISTPFSSYIAGQEVWNKR